MTVQKRTFSVGISITAIALCEDNLDGKCEVRFDTRTRLFSADFGGGGGEHTTSTKSILKIFNRVSVRKVNSLASNLKLLNPILSSFSV